ncbi:hypothetical protein [Prochlorococcus sp. ALOHA_ZT_50]|jgi:hypothetical protein|uniref:hypothetical protein n=1 Tax=Prochlorococcus sp. ALOHA_ZT_50 TaxID=2919303 RepID=UPI00257DA0A1|nr:hypothetical protein [Prochlorococcus sp. ALOHA_ZT_50]MCH2079583.1 hypothetical protein [Prochlorococcus sp. ALOHA_ZT_50]
MNFGLGLDLNLGNPSKGDIVSPPSPAQITYAGSVTGSRGSTFTNVPLGTASLDRLVLFVTTITLTGTKATTMTVNGNAASLIASLGPGFVSSQIWAIKLATATTATVVLNNTSSFGSAIHSYYTECTENISQVLATFNSNTGSSSPVSLTADPDSFLLVGSISNNNSNFITLGGVDTQDFSADVNSTEFAASAHSNNVSGLQSITATNLNGLSNVLVVASAALTSP